MVAHMSFLLAAEAGEHPYKYMLAVEKQVELFAPSPAGNIREI